MIWLSDDQGRAVFLNRRFRQFVGRAEEGLLAEEGWASFIHPEDRSRWLECWRESLASRCALEMEIRYQHHSGVYRWVLLQAEPVLDEQGKVSQWVGAAVDLGQIGVRAQFEPENPSGEEDARAMNAQLELKVIERTRALQETTEQLNEFVYSVAHDLKAPIRAQAAFAALLLNNYGSILGEQGRDFAQRIVAAAHRQGELIGDLLSHVGLSRAEFPIIRVDLGRAVDQARAELQLDIELKGALVENLVPNTAVLANPASLHLAITNLLSNALKFVSWGTQPEVRFRTERGDGLVRLWVEDNGIGIPTQHRDKVFQLFQRLHAREEYPGTGIGLAIVRKAIQRMGGRVGLESEAGKGSRFWFELKPDAAELSAADKSQVRTTQEMGQCAMAGL